MVRRESPPAIELAPLGAGAPRSCPWVDFRFMLDRHAWIAAELPTGRSPLLIVTIDTEEEFDWSKPYSRSALGVSHIAKLPANDRLFERFRLRPTYLVGHPIAAQESGWRPMRELFASQRADIGAHLHPWVTPPFEEDLSPGNSFAGNLAPALERAKIARLTEAIATNIGVRPTIYRAGRFGVGPASAGILEELGYEIDTSVVPRSDFSAEKGPNFTACGLRPYWFGKARRLLEIPLTVGWCGQLRGFGGVLYRAVNSSFGARLRVGGILSRLGLFERVRLSPEGNDFDHLRRLTETLLGGGHTLFNLSFHSSSLVAGHTPYVRDESDRRRFVDTIERYFDFFFGAIGGQAATPSAVRALAAVSVHP